MWRRGLLEVCGVLHYLMSGVLRCSGKENINKIKQRRVEQQVLPLQLRCLLEVIKTNSPNKVLVDNVTVLVNAFLRTKP